MKAGRLLVLGTVIGATFLALGGLLLPAGEDELICLFHDDAFYYLQTARHFASGHGSTFDGLHRTNGYHPLWFLLLSGVARVVQDDLWLLRAVLLVQVGLVSLAGAVLLREVGQTHGRLAGAVAVGAILGLPGTPTSLGMGMEGAVLLACLAGIWTVWSRRTTVGSAESDRGGYAMVGVLCAAAGLARLEAFAIVPAILLAERQRFRRHPMEAAALVAIPATVLLAYIAVNLAFFDVPFPISGSVKAAAGARQGWDNLRSVLELPWPGLASLSRRVSEGTGHALQALALLAAVLVALFGGLGSRFRWLLLAFALWVMADVLVLGAVEPWNAVPLVFSCALVLGAAAKRWPRAGQLVLLLLVCTVGLRAARGMAITCSSYAPHRLAAARWIRGNLPREARVASWNAGMLGFASHRSVVNLDGLVNDREYREEVLRGRRLEAYLRQKEIGWIADQACAAAPTLRPYLSRTGSESLEDRLELMTAFGDLSDPLGCPGYAVWRIQPSPGWDKAGSSLP